MRSHISVNARILHISSMKRTPASMKNDVRPTTSANSSGGTCPESRTASRTAIAFASPYASSCTGVAPASCKWYGQTLIGFHAGTFFTVYTMRSTVSRFDASGGKM